MTCDDAKKKLDERLKDIGGCGDGNCIVHQRPGMHTNGGCRCTKDYIIMFRTVHAYKEYVKNTTKEKDDR